MGRHTRRQLADLDTKELQRVKEAWLANLQNEQELLARFSLSHSALAYMRQAWGQRPKFKDYTRSTD